uniref:Adhesion G protein-coupled receptor A1a n=1 Tax=Labrus bergylta TaxID=56723 RepID=A0A3Q3EDZ3_9LABR
MKPDLKRVLSFPPYPGDYLHPVVYACTAVMLLCLLVSIMTYIVHHRVIRISRNGWHTLLNFLFHTGLTFGVFAGGINQINAPLVCQIVGIVLHYASLSTMMWLTFTARNICKDISKDPLHIPDRNGPAHTKAKFYLVSDGVPLIIVGVTAAFGLENYAAEKMLFCWMAWEPSLGGFYAPVSSCLCHVVYFLCTFIQIKRHPERKYELRVLSEEQQQLSSSESNQTATSTPGGSSNAHSFTSQLRATAFTLFLFMATWALGALHCAKRDDVWHRWWPAVQQRKQPLLPSPPPKLIQDVPASTKPNSQSDGPYCVSVLGPVSPTLMSPLPEPISLPRPQSLSDELPRPVLPLQSCLSNRAKSRSFNRPRPHLQDYRSHMTSTSMDGVGTVLTWTAL